MKNVAVIYSVAGKNSQIKYRAVLKPVAESVVLLHEVETLDGMGKPTWIPVKNNPLTMNSERESELLAALLRAVMHLAGKQTEIVLPIIVMVSP